MNTTIELSDSSADSSVIQLDDSVDSLPSKTVDVKSFNSKKKSNVNNVKLNTTVDLVSSSDEDDDEDDSQEQDGVDNQSSQSVDDDVGFVTAADTTTASSLVHDQGEDLASKANKFTNDVTSFETPINSLSFTPSLSSTSTPAVKFPEDDLENVDKSLDNSHVDSANETISEMNLSTMLFANEVNDELLNTSTNSTVDNNNYNTDTSTHTLVDNDDDESSTEDHKTVDESSKSKGVDNEDDSVSVSSDHSSMTATSDDEDESVERSTHALSLPSKRRRIMEPDLPPTCTVLTSSKSGGRVYLVGTAHFSRESQDDVARVIQSVQPDAVVLELCKARINILHTDEAKIQEEAANLTFDKMLATIRQNGAVQGTMYLFLLYFSAKLTKELGMAPGGEFRRAYLEARNVPGCMVQLGDRPIDVTLKRAFSTLSLWQKLRFGFSILTHRDTITAEDVEKCKQKDLLESMLEEIAGEFPTLSRVFVQERDLFLAHSLRVAVDNPVRFVQQQQQHHHDQQQQAGAHEPPVVVGVVGIGHVAGIIAHWDQVNTVEVSKLMSIPPPSLSSKLTVTAIRFGLMGLGLYATYRFVRVPVSFVKSRLF